MPHFFFWPFDVGRSRADRERARAKTHIDDAVRVGLLASDEGAELRVQGHVMACEACGEQAISLWERVRDVKSPPARARRYSCARARSAVLRHLEGGHPLPEAAFFHLRDCTACADHFLDPGKALHTLAVDSEAVAAQD